jgi:hypothetical protein
VFNIKYMAVNKHASSIIFPCTWQAASSFQGGEGGVWLVNLAHRGWMVYIYLLHDRLYGSLSGCVSCEGIKVERCCSWQMRRKKAGWKDADVPRIRGPCERN